MLLDVQRPEVDELLVRTFNLDQIGKELGINAFDNNLVREIVVCRQAGLLKNMSRGETDAFGRDGMTKYELKSTDIRHSRPAPSWPTSREVSLSVLAAFRSMDYFLFALFDGIDLLALFRAKTLDLESIFKDLETRLEVRAARGLNLNNPKIQWSRLRDHTETILLDPRVAHSSWL